MKNKNQSETETGTENEISNSRNIVLIWKFYVEGLKSYQYLVVVAFVGKFLSMESFGLIIRSHCDCFQKVSKSFVLVVGGRRRDLWGGVNTLPRTALELSKMSILNVTAIPYVLSQ